VLLLPRVLRPSVSLWTGLTFLAGKRILILDQSLDSLLNYLKLLAKEHLFGQWKMNFYTHVIAISHIQMGRDHQVIVNPIRTWQGTFFI
jgi:hypothetical protein